MERMSKTLQDAGHVAATRGPAHEGIAFAAPAGRFFSFFDPYFGESTENFVNTIHSLNIVVGGPNGKVTVSQARLLPDENIRHGAVSQRGMQGRREKAIAIKDNARVITDEE